MAYASGAGGLNNPFNLCKPVVSSASLVGHVLYSYGQPRSYSGGTIAWLSTNSGGALAHQMISAATSSGGRALVGGGDSRSGSCRSSGDQAPQLVAIPPG